MTIYECPGAMCSAVKTDALRTFVDRIGLLMSILKDQVPAERVAAFLSTISLRPGKFLHLDAGEIVDDNARILRDVIARIDASPKAAVEVLQDFGVLAERAQCLNEYHAFGAAVKRWYEQRTPVP